MSHPRVLIVGASIAGPMAAYWLAKAGARITIIERSASLRTAGQNIDIRTAGVSVMRKIPDMEAAVRAKTTTEEGISLMRSDGRPYGTIRATGNPEQQGLVSEYEIFRGDLARILVELTREDERVRYVFGEQVASIQQDRSEKDGAVMVEFVNGKLPTSSFDLVVAADGATSRTRALGLACGVRDHVHPTNNWAAWFSLQHDTLQGSNIGQGYSAVGGRFVGVGPDPCGANRVGLMGINPSGVKGAAAVLPYREALAQGDDAIKALIARKWKGMGWKSDAILADMMVSKDFYASEMVQVKPPSLSKGRFVMIGDAGYAPGPTGTGTTLAMTGAYVLAGEIAKHDGDLDAGLRGYEETMAPIVKEMQKIPPFISSFAAPQTAWGLWIRNNLFGFVAWTGILEWVSRYLGAAFGSSKEYPLPDYKWRA